MRLQVLVDGVDKGEVDLTGPEMLVYANAVGNFAQLVADIYGSENLNGADYLDIRADVSLKPAHRRPRRSPRAPESRQERDVRSADAARELAASEGSA